MYMDNLSQHIEGLVFATEHPITLEEIRECLEKTFETTFKEDDLLAIIGQLSEKYQNDQFAFELTNIGNGYQFLTKGAYHNTIANHLKLTNRKQLSRAALETLSIIAAFPGRRFYR
jgi:segregation and condensation protein B